MTRCETSVDQMQVGAPLLITDVAVGSCGGICEASECGEARILYHQAVEKRDGNVQSMWLIV